MMRLDEHIPDAQIDVLKIDVEGADTLVLAGCEHLLRNQRIRMIYFEQNAEKMEQIGIARDEASRFLRSVGYDSRIIDKRGNGWVAYPG